jgi:phage terminase Nu1 subunit (DNA packaging protein)
MSSGHGLPVIRQGKRPNEDVYGAAINGQHFARTTACGLTNNGSAIRQQPPNGEQITSSMSSVHGLPVIRQGERPNEDVYGAAINAQHFARATAHGLTDNGSAIRQ